MINSHHPQPSAIPSLKNRPNPPRARITATESAPNYYAMTHAPFPMPHAPYSFNPNAPPYSGRRAEKSGPCYLIYSLLSHLHIFIGHSFLPLDGTYPQIYALMPPLPLRLSIIRTPYPYTLPIHPTPNPAHNSLSNHVSTPAPIFTTSKLNTTLSSACRWPSCSERCTLCTALRPVPPGSDTGCVAVAVAVAVALAPPLAYHVDSAQARTGFTSDGVIGYHSEAVLP